MTDLVISLGTNCEVSFNIRNTFGTERAYPFDWWITPLQSVAAIVRDRFALDVAAHNLVHAGTPASIMNRKYGLLHHHDFGHVSADARDESWMSLIPAVADKYRALGERFFADVASARDVLFVVNSDGHHAAYTPPRLLDETVYVEIIQTLRTLFPRTHSRLAIFNSVHEPFDAAYRAAEVDRDILVGPVVKDYGDRREKSLFAKSLRGWSEALRAVRSRLQSAA